jgi:hypothetical protein
MESFRAAIFAYTSHCDHLQQQILEYKKQMNDSFDQSQHELPSLESPSKHILDFYQSKYKFEEKYQKYHNECRFINFISKK